MTEHELRRQLIFFLVNESGLTEVEIERNHRLFSSGVLDSMDLLKVITFLEETSATRIPALDVSMEIFDSIDRIVAYVMSRIPG